MDNILVRRKLFYTLSESSYLSKGQGRYIMVKTDAESSAKPDQRQQQIQQKLALIKNKIVVMSGKGGVGKTTVATNLSISLALKGFKVGLLDVDIHGPNVPKMLGIEDQQLMVDAQGIIPVTAEPNLKVISMAYLIGEKDVPVIWRGPLKMGAIQQFLGDVSWGELDYLVIDLPPGTGDEPLSIAQHIPGANAIIVTTPQEVALMDSRRSVNFAKQLGMNVLGIVENMSGMNCPHCGETIDLFKLGGGEKAASDFKLPFLGKVSIEPGIVLAGDLGKPFILEYPDSVSAKDFDTVVSNIIQQINTEGD